MRLAWNKDGRALELVEPDAALVRVHAARLREWYADRDNLDMMGGEGVASEDEVIEFWSELGRSGGRGFLCFADEALVGDTDLRNIDLELKHAEWAIMIGDAAQKGKGLGAAFARMLHVFAFRELHLERVYVQPKPENVRVRRLESSLGYERDESPFARSLADDPSCLTASISAAVFRARCPDAWTEVKARS